LVGLNRCLIAAFLYTVAKNKPLIMPTISVDKAALFKELGREYTTEEFDELCFEFGIELDEDTTNSDRPVVDGKQEPPQLKIEIPANRYDLLCFEGIQLMLNIFLGRKPLPNYRLVEPANGQLEKIIVKEDVSGRGREFSVASIWTKQIFD
jgi:phenylalanyl-tRNA synthetase beta chain